MSNHLHIVCRAKEQYKISDIIRDLKKYTAKAILKKIESEPESRRDWMLYQFEFAGKYDNRITKYKFWQETNHAILLGDTSIIEQKINYIHENPVKSMIVYKPEEYLFSSATDYAGEKGLISIEFAG